MQHHQSSVGVAGLQAAGLIQTQNSQTVLNQAQRLPVDLIWMEQEIHEACASFRTLLKNSSDWEESWTGEPFVRASRARAHSVLPSDVRMPKGGKPSLEFSDIFTIFSSWTRISISLSCLLFATTSNTKNYQENGNPVILNREKNIKPLVK